MKKILALVLALCLALTMLAACGDKIDDNKVNNPANDADNVNNADDNADNAADASDDNVVDEEDVPAPAGVMTYAEYAAAELDTQVTVETYVQAKQSWWDDKATFYTQDKDGAYFIYNMPVSKEEYDKLVPGTKIRVNGYKAEWSGEVEIIDATYEIIDGDSFIAAAEDVTALLGTDELINKQNMFVSFKGMTVEATQDADGNDVAYLYKWDGSGQEGDDLYFKVSVGGNTYTFLVESYLCGADTEVYQAVKALNVGDVIDLEGYLYWYEGVQPHITSVSAAQ